MHNFETILSLENFIFKDFLDLTYVWRVDPRDRHSKLLEILKNSPCRPNNAVAGALNLPVVVVFGSGENLARFKSGGQLLTPAIGVIHNSGGANAHARH